MKDRDVDIYLFLCQTRKEETKRHTECICCTSMAHISADTDKVAVHIT